MKATILTIMLLTVAASGCVASDSASTPAPSPSTAPTTNVDNVAVTHGLAGPNVTRSESVAYHLNTTGPASVELTFNGTTVHSGIVNGTNVWTLALPYGSRDLALQVDAPGVSVRHNVTITRLALIDLTIDYCTFHPDSPSARKVDAYTSWVNIDDWPTTRLYQENGTQHTSSFVVHDLMWLWSREHAVAVNATYNPSFQGYAMNSIDGVGGAVDASSPPYWLFEINGASSNVGMSLAPVAAGDDVRWVLSTLGPPCQ